MKGVLINGKFLSQRITGVQRYAIEIVNALDNMIFPGQLEIAVPPNAQNVPRYRNIRIKRVGHFKGILWEQISFAVYALRHKKAPLNLCNVSPLLCPGFVCIHDVKIRACPQYFSKSFIFWYRLLFLNAMRRAYQVVTDSEFSKDEIKKYYGGFVDRICVIFCSWEHYERVGYDGGVLKKYQLSSDGFYFALGSMDPNKNLKWLANAAKKNQDSIFALAGSVNKTVFAEAGDFTCPPNVRFLGYVSDEEAKTLMRECRAFLFPSFYEGFGIPPLEALSAGAKRVVVSDIPVMHEIFSDAVSYIDPYGDNVDLTQINEISEEKRNEILDRYRWEESAREWLRILDSYLQ